MAFLFVLKYVLSTCKTLFLESCTASTTMFSLLIPYLAPFFSIFHPRHQITGGNITYIHSTHTPLARRDEITITMKFVQNDFYSHAPCGARPTAFLIGNSVPNISTHTPLARRDHRAAFHSSCTSISTHTSLARRDLNFDHMYRHDRNFYSHAPCGARRFTRACLDVISRFLLTRPMRGAMGRSKWVCRCECDFYSHASCEARPDPVVAP